MANGQGNTVSDRRSVLIGLTLVLLAAVSLRAATFLELRDGPLFHLQAWTQSDMHFFDSWAEDIRAGDLLTEQGKRPYHGRHVNLACRAFVLSGGRPEACTPEQVRAIWDDWVGEASLWQDPLYPYLLAALYSSTGSSPTAVYLAHAALGLACVVLVYLIALRLYDRRGAAAAGLAAAFFGPLLFYETTLLRAVPIAAVGLAACYALMLASARESERRLVVFAAGLLAGLLCLLKFSWLLTVVFWVAYLGFTRRGDGLRRVCETGGLYLGGVAVGMAPLFVRNAMLGQPLLRGAATGPINFINGNAADRVAGTGSAISAFAAEILSATQGRPGATLQATIGTHEGVADWLALLGAKLAMFFSGREIPNNVNYEYFLEYASIGSSVSIGFAAIAALAAIGLCPVGTARTGRAPALIYILSGIAVCVLFFNLSRFRLPIACMMLPLAGGGVSQLIDMATSRRWAAMGALSALALGVMFAVATSGQDESVKIRIADYGVANQIAVELARRAANDGEPGKAIRMVLDQLEGEPELLQAIRPGPDATRISVQLSGVAGTFVELHQFIAEAQPDADLVDAATREHHRRRAQVLRALNQPYAAAGLE